MNSFLWKTGKSEWVNHDFVVERPTFQISTSRLSNAIYMLPHCVVFHPFENLIFPGKLDVGANFPGNS